MFWIAVVSGSGVGVGVGDGSGVDGACVGDCVGVDGAWVGDGDVVIVGDGVELGIPVVELLIGEFEFSGW